MHFFTILLTAAALQSYPQIPSGQPSNAPDSKPSARIEYLTDAEIVEFERHGVHNNLGKMIKHRDETGQVHTISWDEEK